MFDLTLNGFETALEVLLRQTIEDQKSQIEHLTTDLQSARSTAEDSIYKLQALRDEFAIFQQMHMRIAHGQAARVTELERELADRRAP